MVEMLTVDQTQQVVPNNEDGRYVALFNEAFSAWSQNYSFPDHLIDLELGDHIFTLAFRSLSATRQLSNQLCWFVGDYYNALRRRFTDEEIAQSLSPDYGVDELNQFYDIKTLEIYARIAAEFGPSERNFNQPFRVYRELYESSQRLAREQFNVGSEKLSNELFAQVKEEARRLRSEPLSLVMESTEPIKREMIRDLLRKSVAKINAEEESDLVITHEGKELVLVQYKDGANKLFARLIGRIRWRELLYEISRLLGLSSRSSYPVDIRITEPITGQHCFRCQVMLPKRGSTEPIKITQLEYEFIPNAELTEETVLGGGQDGTG